MLSTRCRRAKATPPPWPSLCLQTKIQVGDLQIQRLFCACERNRVAVCAAQHVAGGAVDQEQALNKSTKLQRARSGKQHLNNVTQQVLISLCSTDLPNASQLDLSQLNQARAVWHQHRCTHWLWVIASTAAVYVSFFTVYHIGLGIFPGILGMVTAVWGLWWLCLQPEQQASNMKYFFKVDLDRPDNRVFCHATCQHLWQECSGACDSDTVVFVCRCNVHWRISQLPTLSCWD